MSEVSASISPMKKYIVSYTAQYEVEALDEDEAVDQAIEIHFDVPDGIWEAEEID
jgi:hypothetical protein